MRQNALCGLSWNRLLLTECLLFDLTEATQMTDTDSQFTDSSEVI